MNVLKLFPLLFWFFLIHSALVAQEKTEKALFIIVDGIPADVLERVNTPYIDLISAEGAYTRAYLGGEKDGYSETPTISAVGYNSLLTGTWANKHNVWDNDIKAPNYNYWTIFRMFKEQYPEKKTAVFSTWQDNRTKLVGEGLAATGSLKLDYSFDGLELDTVNYPHDDEFYIQKIDEEVTAKAAAVLREKGPDLTWVYLQFTDNTGHQYGDGPENTGSLQVIDRQVGDIYSSIKYREQYFNEEWLVFVTTDHGRKVLDGKGHGGQSEREKTVWISTNSKKLNPYFYSSKPAIVDLLPSMADHLGIDIPASQRFELDGITLLGEVSVSHPEAKLIGNELRVSWEPYHDKGTVKIWLTETNRFAVSGEADDYQLAGEVDILKGNYLIPLKKKKADRYKIVIEGKYNTINRWLEP